MNSQHRAIRAMLRSMSPRRAAEYIKAFGLPESEEALLLAIDVHRQNYTQLMELGYSPECIKRARRRAYGKIADELNHRNSPTAF